MLFTKDILVKTSKASGFTQKDISAILESFTEVLADEMAKGESIRVNNLGTFEVKITKERVGRNPKTGEEITIPSRKVPKFKPSANLKRIVES